jgi:methenyltetrahydromethanopterin cyclohydrolase
MQLGIGLNQFALDVFLEAKEQHERLRIKPTTLECGARVLDFGVEVAGGLAAGIKLAEICMSGHAEVRIVHSDRSIWTGPWVQVATDHPTQACMLSQYAGWPVKLEKFFAMGSGAMRIKRGREPLLLSLAACDESPVAVGTLECDQIPSCSVATLMAEECSVAPSSLYLAVAPTRSVAGCVQVVARSIETSLHKLHELGFPLDQVRSASGVAPLPPPTPDFAKGIGRTNDAILYGGHVTLWLDGDDEQIMEISGQLPSCASKDFGAPFVDTFRRYEFDFYKVDPGLFSPAEVMLINLKSGKSWRVGAPRADLVAQSFGVK